MEGNKFKKIKCKVVKMFDNKIYIYIYFRMGGFARPGDEIYAPSLRLCSTGSHVNRRNPQNSASPNFWREKQWVFERFVVLQSRYQIFLFFYFILLFHNYSLLQLRFFFNFFIFLILFVCFSLQTRAILRSWKVLGTFPHQGTTKYP